MVPMTANPASAVDGEYLSDLYTDTSAVSGATQKVIECWDGNPGTTYLLMKQSSGWKKVASSSAKRSKFCGKDGYLATYKWKVNVLPKKNANGNRWINMATSGTPYFSKYTYPEKVQVMTLQEYDQANQVNQEELPAPITPAPAPAPVPAPAPAPAPVPAPAPAASPNPTRTLTPKENEFLGYLIDVALSQPDKQARRCLSLSSPSRNADSASFYDLGAWTGVQRFQLTNESARFVTVAAYGIHCGVMFDLDTVRGI